MNFGRIMHSHDAIGPCDKVSGIEHGSEDIEMLANGVAFITSKLVEHDVNGQPLKGSIYKFDLTNKNSKPELLKIEGENFRAAAFRPHGLSLFQAKNTGKVTIFVANHDKEGEAVEKFEYEEGSSTLKHIESIKSPGEFVYVNDIVAVSENEFYYTNSFYLNIPPLEILAQIPWANVGFYDGKNTSSAASGFVLANGIQRSPDFRTLYVANDGKREVCVYKRENDNSLTLLQSIPTDSMVDNLNYNAETGEIWAAGHPVGTSIFTWLFWDSSRTIPSQVLRFKMNVDHTIRTVYEAYANDGSEVIGSSVALRYKDQVLVGTIASDMHICKVVFLNE
ncbi:hypothetical protein CAPTEDRAFT_151713 [Capitella teleta]|uniref:Paraoxonase n=1 Tax=Capitella teleta TaxID=283909 RepID=R7V967_CAPTE|nr:hypothetical protein CAPTEDRAFT_151713 [Capitella teleta]|eukprot:ELU15052.1 hypothetical protein CAPTEDRAFT_151713 [Capitella teleta]